MKKIKVLIVEDSPVVRELLIHIINSDPRLEVGMAVESGEKALEVMKSVRPDVISMDIRLPGINGFETTQKIMVEYPTPIVVVSASVSSPELNITMNALRAGALAVVEKPTGLTSEDYEMMAQSICDQLAIMSEVAVIRQRIRRDVSFSPDQKDLVPEVPKIRKPYEILAVVTSTGGPNALLELLNSFDDNFPLPILLVQHITSKFLDGFVNWLEMNTPFKVVKVSEPETIKKGVVYLAREDHHLVIRNYKVCVDQSAPVKSQRPSGDVLFDSVARTFREKAIGVIMTGMGEDGARGLKSIKEAGGYTIGESQKTALIYGMPRVAAELGGVCKALPLPLIGPFVNRLVKLKE